MRMDQGLYSGIDNDDNNQEVEENDRLIFRMLEEDFSNLWKTADLSTT